MPTWWPWPERYNPESDPGRSGGRAHRRRRPLIPRSLSFALALASVAVVATAAPSGRLEKLGRILALEDARSVGGDELNRYLADSDRSVRRRAALAAGRIGDPAAVDRLLDLLRDAEPEVRQMSAFALGLIGERRAADALVKALADSDGKVRGRAAEALGRLGDGAHAEIVAQRVLAAIPPGASGQLTIRGDDAGSADDPWAELRLGLLALGRLGDASAAESALLDGGRPRFDWWAAAYAAMRVGGPRLRPVLDAAVRSTDAFARALAAQGLGSFPDDEALGAIVTLTADEDPRVAASALRALGRYAESQWASRVAAEALTTSDPGVQTEALAALEKLKPERAVRDRAVDLIGSPDPALRAGGIRLLSRIDPEQFALIRSGLDPDPVWFARAALAAGLSRVGDQSGLEQLFAMLNSETDPRVLPAVLDALRVVRGADAVPTLVQALEHPDIAVRRAAAAGLGQLEVDPHGDALAEAYRRSLGDVEVEARLAIVEALAALGGDAHRAELAGIARDDPARAVRERAAQAHGDVSVGVPAPGEPRPPVDYLAAALPLYPGGAPVYTPRAIVHTSRGVIEMHLDTIEAPVAVASFVALAKRGFYDGLDFHRVVRGFVVQGGCPRGDGLGGPGFRLRSEVGQQPFGRGAVGLALAGADTGGSQFFITQFPAPHLDGAYPRLGQIARGMDVVDALRPGDRIDRIEIWDGR